MTSPAYTYTFANGTTADASQVMQNFNDILNGVSDGTKDLSISALTCAGTATLNGHINLGNASADDLTVTASLASTIPVKTTASYDIGSSTLGLRSVYLGRNSQTVRLIPSATMSATWTLTLPVTAGTANYVLLTDGSGVTSWSPISSAAGVIAPQNGGTGQSNTSGATLTRSGDHALTITTTNTTSITLPTSGTLLAAGAASIVNADISTSAAIAGSKLQAAGASNAGTVSAQTTGTFTATFVQTGGYSQAVTVNYQRIGLWVTIAIPAFSASATASAPVNSGATDVPSSLFPVVEFRSPVPVNLNGTTQTGLMIMTTTGQIQIYATMAAANFVSGQTAGFGNGGTSVSTYHYRTS